MQMKKKLITSALPYVNNVPHLGNIIGSVLSADVYARYCRLRGYDTLYICATDEYGTATEIKALESKTTPQEICDKYHQIHKEVYRFFNISFDYFGRTSTPEHTQITQKIFLKLEQAGYIFEEESEQTYCEKDKMFLADRFVEGTCPYCEKKAKGDQCDSCGVVLDAKDLIEPKCKICQNKPIFKKTKHLYLDLKKLETKLVKFYEANLKRNDFLVKNARQVVRQWLKNEITKNAKKQARPISRDLKWGVPIPESKTSGKEYEEKVFYVWFDAVLGYISATIKHLPDDWQKWWQSADTELYQFMAKDNIHFHTILLPAMMLGSEEKWTMLHHLNSSEYLNYEKSKFSKSLGVGVFGDDVIKIGLPADLWRFYLLYNRPETSDSVFEWEKFYEEVNAHLVDNLGNLLNRVTVFLAKNFQNKICITAELEKNKSPLFKEWVSYVTEKEREIDELLEKVELRKALHQIFILAKRANKLFQDKEPWKKIKEDKDEVFYLLYLLVALLQDLALMLYPFIPSLATKILDNLNLTNSLNAGWKNVGNWEKFKNHTIKEGKILLSKLEFEEVLTLKKKYSKKTGNL